MIHKQIIMNNPRAINSSWSGRSVVLWTTAMDILLRNRSERNLQSSQRQSPSNCNMMMIKGAYTLVHATSENAGNLLILMLRYVTKSGDNLYIVCNARSQGSVTTENPREVGPIVLSEIQLAVFLLYFKQPWLFPSIHNPKPLVRCRVVGMLEPIPASRAKCREISRMNCSFHTLKNTILQISIHQVFHQNVF